MSCIIKSKKKQLSDFVRYKERNEDLHDFDLREIVYGFEIEQLPPDALDFLDERDARFRHFYARRYDPRFDR
jgi:hypothetical protein